MHFSVHILQIDEINNDYCRIWFTISSLLCESNIMKKYIFTDYCAYFICHIFLTNKKNGNWIYKYTKKELYRKVYDSIWV